MSLRNWRNAAASVALLGLAAIGTGISPAEAGPKLVLKRFLLGKLEPLTNKFIPTGGPGTSNAYRDNVIMLVFTRPVDPGSIDARSVKIGIPASGGLFIDADGDLYPSKQYDEKLYHYTVYKLDPVAGAPVPKRTYKNRVIFDPTKRLADSEARNPFGFEENSTYRVEVPGVEDGTTRVVRGRKGEMNLRTFVTSFQTTDKYLQDYNQPRIVSVTASDAPTIPLEGRTNVDSRADIVVTFSEPMLPAAFDPNTTFQVYNFGQSRLMSGVLRPSPDGTEVTFRPAFGYGRGPYDVRVTLSRDLTDRSSNKLDKGLVVNFTTEFDPFAPNYDELVESFDDTLYADFTAWNTFDFASWNGWVGPTNDPSNNTKKELGTVAGVFGARSLDITFSNNQSGYAVPWWVNPVHCQNLYYKGQLGSTARSISGYAWVQYLINGRANAATYSSTTVQLGHNTSGSVQTNFTGSFSDTPVTVFQGSYSPNTSEVQYITGPTFSKNWAYNGKDNLVLDHNTATNGTTVNYWRYITNAGGAGSTMYDTLNGTTVLAWNHDIRFFYLVDQSEALSKWYDSTVNNPTWLDPIVQQSVPPGTVVSIQFQGGLENPSQLGSVDPATLTPWTSDPFNDLGGFRFIRFKVDMTSNIGSATRPTIDEVKLPYIYF